MKRIPKRFRLGAHEITVKVVTEAAMAAIDETVPLGLWVPCELTIYLQKPDRTLKREVQIHTFWHEFYHAMFWALGRTEMSADEVLVDQCGLLTMQAMQSAEH